MGRTQQGCTQTDLTIDSALADPVIGALMRADRVDPKRFEAWLRQKAQNLGGSRGAAGTQARALDLGRTPALPGGLLAW